MLSIVILFGFSAFSSALVQQMVVPYVPPSGDAIFNRYFTTASPGKNNSLQEMQPVEERFREAMNSNVTTYNDKKVNLDAFETNITTNETGSAKPVNDELWIGLLRRLLRNSHYTKPHRYPTATWTAEQHEKLKEYEKNRLRKMPKVFLVKPLALVNSEIPRNDDVPRLQKVASETKRGKIKWKDTRKNSKPEIPRKIMSKEDIDKFLEKSLFRYLISSNLIQNIGNVPVETFSALLRNVTRHKTDRRQFWPYDENKELRIKFRDEVFMKKKNENHSRGRFLEKQLQRRLERMQYLFSSKLKEKPMRSKNTTQVQSSKWTLDAESTTFVTSFIVSANTEPATAVLPLTNITETSVSDEFKTHSTQNIQDTGRNELDELKLSVAETVYYKKRPPMLHTLRVGEGETGVIPGVPHVDYPMYSSPPRTGFKCPDGIGEQPRMMADVNTRCQVFYVCTGDGPAAAMLCPNGTMFNENVRVCDWWYNVDC